MNKLNRNLISGAFFGSEVFGSDPGTSKLLNMSNRSLILNTNSLSSRKFKRALIECQIAFEGFEEAEFRSPSEELCDSVAELQERMFNKSTIWFYDMTTERSSRRMWWRIVRLMRLWHSDEKLTKLLQAWISSDMQESVEHFVSAAEKLNEFDDLPISWAIEMIETDRHLFSEEVYDDTVWDFPRGSKETPLFGKSVLSECIFCV